MRKVYWILFKKPQGKRGQKCKDFTLAKASELAVVHEANHSPASTAKVKNAWSCTSIPSGHGA
jgi:hypothetical protein